MMRYGVRGRETDGVGYILADVGRLWPVRVEEIYWGDKVCPCQISNLQSSSAQIKILKEEKTSIWIKHRSSNLPFPVVHTP